MNKSNLIKNITQGIRTIWGGFRNLHIKCKFVKVLAFALSLLLIFSAVVPTDVFANEQTFQHENEETTFNYILNNDVIVINQPPQYELVATPVSHARQLPNDDELFTVVMPATCNTVLSLSVDDLFILGPTDTHIDGIAGRVVFIENDSTYVTIVASLPYLEELFYELVFSIDLNLLEEEGLEIIPVKWDNYSPYGIAPLSSSSLTPIINMNQNYISIGMQGVFSGELGNLSGSVELDGAIRLDTPRVAGRVQTRFGFLTSVDLTLTTGAQFNLDAKFNGSFDTTIHLFTLRLPVDVKLGGKVARLDIPVGIRFFASGEIGLEIMCRIDARFGIWGGNVQLNFEASHDFRFNFQGEAHVALNVQAQMRLFGIHIYGIMGDFGKGVRVDSTMQNRCPQRLCIVVGKTFYVGRISSANSSQLTRIRQLRFSEDITSFLGLTPTWWHLYDGNLQTFCPHSQTGSQQPSPNEIPPGSTSAFVNASATGFNGQVNVIIMRGLGVTYRVGRHNWDFVPFMETVTMYLFVPGNSNFRENYDVEWEVVIGSPSIIPQTWTNLWPRYTVSWGIPEIITLSDEAFQNAIPNVPVNTGMVHGFAQFVMPHGEHVQLRANITPRINVVQTPPVPQQPAHDGTTPPPRPTQPSPSRPIAPVQPAQSATIIDGQVYNRAPYSGLPHGVIAQANYINGQRHGPRTIWSTDGIIQYMYIAGELKQLTTWSIANSNVQQIIFSYGLPAQIIFWTSDGTTEQIDKENGHQVRNMSWLPNRSIVLSEFVGSSGFDFQVSLWRADGTVYQGGWYRGQPHGQGTEWSSNGRVRSGIWQKGVFIEISSEAEIASTSLSQYPHQNEACFNLQGLPYTLTITCPATLSQQQNYNITDTPVTFPNTHRVSQPLSADKHIRLMHGFDDGTFRPNVSITRAELALILFRLLENENTNAQNLNRFNDVNSASWYGHAVNYLAGRNILLGFPDGSFRPNYSITRAELVTVLSRFFGRHGQRTAIFHDVSNTHWAFNHIMNAYCRGWITGFEDETFRPNNTTTRAEAATIINRAWGRQPNPETIRDYLNGQQLFTDLTNLHWAFYQIMEAVIEHSFYIDSQGREVWTNVVLP